MPSPRKKNTPARAGLLQQAARHIALNGMTTMFGICVGLPQVAEGYANKDWRKVGEGATEILLGFSGSDRFGIKKSTDQPTA